MSRSNNSFFKTEDFSALVIGVFILTVGLMIHLGLQRNDIKEQIAPFQMVLKEEINEGFKTVEWYDAFDQIQAVQGRKLDLGARLYKLTNKPGSWKSNPLESFQMSEAMATEMTNSVRLQLDAHRNEVEVLRKGALQAQKRAADLEFKEDAVNKEANIAIDVWRDKIMEGASLVKKSKITEYNKWLDLFLLFIVFAVLFGLGHVMMQGRFFRFVSGFAMVFMFGVLSHFLAGESTMKEIGFGYAAWAILLGLIVSNTIGTPDWVKPALKTELFIKAGLVILGAEILFSKILAIGLPGIFVAWLVTPIVLISTYWFGQKVLKISSKTLNMTVSADMSVCGVSAAVATAAACRATKEELTLSIGLSMIFTSVMMIVLPMVIGAMGLPEILGGAWIGGTIDATGAVVAAGAFLGNDALNVAATIKMIQNILIGVIAFGVAIYFTRMGSGPGTKIGVGEIWKRFPKFIIGFIGASIVFSVIYSSLGPHEAYSILDQGAISGFSSRIRGWLFCLAFVSIGLSTNFKELKSHFTGGKPLILYICGQSLNLMLTLLMAYIMFYLVFPDITASI